MYLIGLLLSQVFYNIALSAMNAGNTNAYTRYMSLSNRYNDKYVLPRWVIMKERQAEKLRMFAFTNRERTEPEV